MDVEVEAEDLLLVMVSKGRWSPPAQLLPLLRSNKWCVLVEGRLEIEESEDPSVADEAEVEDHRRLIFSSSGGDSLRSNSTSCLYFCWVSNCSFFS